MATLKSPHNTSHQLQEKRHWARLRGRRWLLVVATGGLLLAWLLALLSYSPWDAAFSTSGDGAPLRNWLGFYGANLADLSYYFFGFTVWLLLVACVRLWLAALWDVAYGRLRTPPEKITPQTVRAPNRWWPMARFHLGLWLMVGGACTLEWSRLQRLDAHLPGTAGGVLGLLLGATGEKNLGFNGTALLGVACLVLGFAWAFRFSWINFAETLGAWLASVVQGWRNRREEKRDLAAGAQAAHEREAQLRAQTQAQEQEQEHSPANVPVLQPASEPLSKPAAQRQNPSRIEPQGLEATAPNNNEHAAADLASESGLVPESLPESPAIRMPDSLTLGSAAAAFAAPSVPVHQPAPAPSPSVRVQNEKQSPLFNELAKQLPAVHLLDPALTNQVTVAPETLSMTSRLIEKKLKDFGVSVTVVAAYPGPVITRYEIEPATGVKGSQIVNLAKDLARSLSLVSIRVIETIPGKNCMALELPNPKRQTISLSEVIGSSVYDQSKSLLTMALGKDIVGLPVVADLGKMPHLLVAGTTGSGKSVGINAMILSLLYKAEPAQVRLMLIDPKMLEMSVYEGIPHLLCPVVTDMRQAANGLNWCVAEMEKRYRLMSKMGVRNLAGYNQKIAEATARGELLPNPFSLTPDAPEPLEVMPQIVIVIDELADLMMVVGKKIEELIARLAQKARAAGVHLILATQRPSVDVITGLIKANVPSRIAFQVSSKIDSRTILDQGGAEALLGMGDMLYMPVGSGFPTRVHGAFVSDEEVHRVVEQLKTFAPAQYIDGILEGGTVDGEDGGDAAAGGAAGGSGENDPMYDQAVAVVLKQGKATTSLIQRHLKIGYGRAARILEEMENAGLVSKMDHRNQRELLVPTSAAGSEDEPF
jgi:S-DNA-T family DNA segregation ATPase FtsK/SpoIIIE